MTTTITSHADPAEAARRAIADVPYSVAYLQRSSDHAVHITVVCSQPPDLDTQCRIIALAHQHSEPGPAFSFTFIDPHRFQHCADSINHPLANVARDGVVIAGTPYFTATDLTGQNESEYTAYLLSNTAEHLERAANALQFMAPADRRRCLLQQVNSALVEAVRARLSAHRLHYPVHASLDQLNAILAQHVPEAVPPRQPDLAQEEHDIYQQAQADIRQLHQDLSQPQQRQRFRYDD